MSILVESPYFFEHPANLSEGDVEALLEIENEAFLVDAYNRDQLLEEYQKDPMLFIVSRNKSEIPVGYISGDLRDNTGTVVSLAVDRSMRRLGVGGGLLSVMLTHLESRGAEVIEAQVRPDNEASIRLFRNFGFLVVGRLENYYRDNSPALSLKKGNSLNN